MEHDKETRTEIEHHTTCYAAENDGCNTPVTRERLVTPAAKCTCRRVCSPNSLCGDGVCSLRSSDLQANATMHNAVPIVLLKNCFRY